MGAVTYPDPRVAKMAIENFIPVQINVIEHPEYTDKFLARWTPTIIFLDSQGREHRRLVGYTIPDDFLAEMGMGLSQQAFNNKRYDEATGRYQTVVDRHPNAPVAPEALYMIGVCKYRSTDDGNYLTTYWDEVMERYPDSRWARAGDV
jgi:hypothetical protein